MCNRHLLYYLSAPAVPGCYSRFWFARNGFSFVSARPVARERMYCEPGNTHSRRPRRLHYKSGNIL